MINILTPNLFAIQRGIRRKELNYKQQSVRVLSRENCFLGNGNIIIMCGFDYVQQKCVDRCGECLY